jgi:hypothetical protein
MPTTKAEHAAVLREMDRLLSSRHFRNSKRYPALFEHIIRETLAGKADSLKERVLGVAVFHRPADYDANEDPIVRVTAGEVRKRIAQFYHEEAAAEEVCINLRPGSYVPEFNPVLRVQEETGDVPGVVPVSPGLTAGAQVTRVAPRRMFTLTLMGVACLALVAVLGLTGFSRWHAMDQRAQMWHPLLSAAAPVLIVVGQPHPTQLKTAFAQSPTHALELADAIAMARLTNVLDAQHHLYQIAGVDSTSLSDLRKGPVILVGGFNNPWSLRMLSQLRFSLRASGEGLLNDDAAAPQIAQIVDRKGQPGSPWTVDFRQSADSMTHDYAIIARFQANMTDGEVMAIAGLGSRSTESASKFASSTAYMTQLARYAPRNWRTMNMEAVVETEVIDGRAGHPHVIATDFW